MATEQIEQFGLYRQYADGSIFEMYVLRCACCGRHIDIEEESFYLRVTPNAPDVSMHAGCAAVRAIVLG